MKNVIKRSLWIVAFLCFSLFAATVFSGLSVKANAEAGAYFKMMDGAYIRPVTETLDGAEDQNGIRFSTYLSKAYVDALANEYTFTDTEYYTLIATDGRAVADLTYGADGVTAISWKPNFKEDGSYTRNTDLLNCPAEYYRTEFTVLSCIRLVNGEEEVAVVYASANDVKRSMEGCAIAHLTENPDEAKDFGKYLGGGEIYVDEAAANAEVSGAAEIKIENITTDLSAKTLAIYNGARKVESATLSADGVLTIPATEISELSAGKEYVYTVSDGKDVYKKTVNTWDFIISDADEFDGFVSAVRATTYINGKTSASSSSDKHSSHPYYAILDSDITLTKTYKNNTLNDATWNGVFEGTLDGDGHVLSGYKIGVSALFSALGGTATIKNIAIVDATQSYTGSSYLVAGSATGSLHIENSYIEATFATAGRIGLLNVGSTISLTDSVLNFTKTKESNYGVFYASQPEKIENSVIIANCGLGVEPSENWSNWGLYSDYVAIKGAELDYLSAFDTNYWTVSNGYPLFKGTTLSAVSKTFENTTHFENRATDGFAIDFSAPAYSGMTVSSVTSNGEELAAERYNFANDVLTIDNDAFTTTMTANVTNYSYEIAVTFSEMPLTVNQTVEVADYAIGNETEFKAWYNDVKSTSRNTSANVSTKPMRVVLTDNIYLTEIYGADTKVTDNASTLSGRMDGNGYGIYNLTVGGQALFFTVAKFSIHNTALVNWQQNVKTGAAYIFASQANSLLYFYDVYAEFNIETFGTDIGLVNLGYQSYAYNSTFKINTNSNTGYFYRSTSASYLAHLYNTNLITRDNVAENYDTSANAVYRIYKDAAEMNAAASDFVIAENGESSYSYSKYNEDYWQYTDGKFTFKNVAEYDDVYVYGFNRKTNDPIAVNVGTGYTVNSVKINGEEKAYNYNDGVVTLSGLTFDAVDTYYAVISATKDGKTDTFVKPIKVVDYAIGTEEEFNAWRKDLASQTGSNDTASTEANHKILYAALTNNVTMTGTMPNFGNDSDVEGELDGLGYAIINLKSATYSMFNKSVGNGFTFKNIAFKNYVNSKASSAASAFFYGNGGKVYYSNCYIEYTRTAKCTRSFMAYNAYYRNCLIELHTTNTATNVFHDTKNLNLINTLVISPAPLYTDINGQYADEDAIANDNSAKDIVNKFASSSYWDITNGYPEWKSIDNP